jgi:hypothetical protein
VLHGIQLPALEPIARGDGVERVLEKLAVIGPASQL